TPPAGRPVEFLHHGGVPAPPYSPLARGGRGGRTADHDPRDRAPTPADPLAHAYARCAGAQIRRRNEPNGALGNIRGMCRCRAPWIGRSGPRSSKDTDERRRLSVPPHPRPRGMTLGALALVTLTIGRVVADDGPADAEVRGAIERGIEHLRSRQGPEGN